MGFVKSINLRPIRIIGIIIALHTVIYGLGYIVGGGGFLQTLLYSEIGEIVSQQVFGWIMLTVGAGVVYAYLQDKVSLVSRLSTIQSTIWLFATFVYFLDGAFFLGIGIGLIWTILSGYTAFAFKHKDRTVNNLMLEKLFKD